MARKEVKDRKESKDNNNNGKNDKNNVWKITAIIFIILFVVIIVSALVRLNRFKPPLIKPTDSQVSIVKNIALDDLSNRGEVAQNFSISTSSDIRPVNVGQATKKVIEVSVYNDSIRHLYIIDIDSGAVLLYSKTESFGFINYSNERPVPPGNMELGFDRRLP